MISNQILQNTIEGLKGIARGLKPEMVERKESLIYLCASVGMNVFFRCLGKAGVSAAEIFIFKSGILALLLWAVRRVSIWRAFLVFGWIFRN